MSLDYVLRQLRAVVREKELELIELKRVLAGAEADYEEFLVAKEVAKMVKDRLEQTLSAGDAEETKYTEAPVVSVAPVAARGAWVYDREGNKKERAQYLRDTEGYESC